MSTLYSEIRDTLKTGDLISWKAGKVNSFFSLILKLYQKILRPKSVHVGVVFVTGGRVFVVEARPPEIRIYPLSKMENFYLISTNIEEKNANVDFLLEKVGVNYGILDLIKGIIFSHGKGNKKIYCSEFAALYYEAVKLLDAEKYKDAWRTPDNLIEAICEITGSKPIYVKIDKDNFYGV